MTVERVRDAGDPRLADYVALTDMELRRRLEPAGGLFVAEGEKVIRRALAAGYPPRSVLLSQRWVAPLGDLVDGPLAGVDVLVADDALLHEVTGYAVHRGALSAMGRLPLPTPVDVLEPPGPRRVAVLADVVDPTNVGAVFRAAAGLGLDAVVLSPSCADPLYRRSVKVSMGTVFSVPYARLDSWPGGIQDLKVAGYRVLALTPEPSATPIDQLPGTDLARCALVLGAEGDGLSARALAAADVTVRIPMAHGVDSLNVGAAAAVAFYAVTR